MSSSVVLPHEVIAKAVERAGVSVPEFATCLRGFLLREYSPGDGVMAVLRNDLFGALSRMTADDLERVARFVYNHVPASISGSRERADAWVRDGVIS